MSDASKKREAAFISKTLTELVDAGLDKKLRPVIETLVSAHAQGQSAMRVTSDASIFRAPLVRGAEDKFAGVSPLIYKQDRDAGSGTLMLNRHYRAALRICRALEKRGKNQPLSSVSLGDPVWQQNKKTHQKFSDEQKQATNTALRQPITVIVGGPGTGKTATICAIAAGAIARGVEAEAIVLAAPTGKAAHRLSEAVAAFAFKDASTFENATSADPGTTLLANFCVTNGQHSVGRRCIVYLGLVTRIRGLSHCRRSF